MKSKVRYFCYSHTGLVLFLDQDVLYLSVFFKISIIQQRKRFLSTEWSRLYPQGMAGSTGTEPEDPACEISPNGPSVVDRLVENYFPLSIMTILSTKVQFRAACGNQQMVIFIPCLAPNSVQYFLCACRIHLAYRFVHGKDFRHHREHACNADPLLLTP